MFATQTCSWHTRTKNLYVSKLSDILSFEGMGKTLQGDQSFNESFAIMSDHQNIYCKNTIIQNHRPIFTKQTAIQNAIFELDASFMIQ